MDGHEHGHAYRVGRFTLHPHRQLLADGVPVVIRRKSLTLLSVLAEAQGALVTKDELMDRVWSRRVVEDNAIQVQVASLRKLLGGDGDRLSTVRGLGYRLDVAPAPVGPARTDARRADVDVPPPLADGRAPAAAPGGRRSARIWAALGVAVVCAAAALALASRRPGREAGSANALPADPAAAALLVQARDEWAQRDAASLALSIAHLQRVTRLAPGFAPAYADLADAYLLAGEAGSLPETVAFDGAEHAAARARKLDRRSPGAFRALGFVRYWWRHDRPGAAQAFRTALRLDPTAAQTHFWYANTLADNGEFPAAGREFDRARLAEPGSDQIAADYGWALWSAGHARDGTAIVREVVARSPGNAEAQDCLAGIALAEGDDASFLAALKARAGLRREPALEARAAALSQAYARGGRPALLRAALAAELAEQADSPFPDRSTAAFYASLAGDRTGLADVLHAAEAARERWGSAGYVGRMRARWRGDAPIVAALDRLKAPRLEATG